MYHLMDLIYIRHDACRYCRVQSESVFIRYKNNSPPPFIYRHPQYLSPEVLCECPVQYDEHSESEPAVLTPSGPKSDVWSLGLILLEALTVSYMHMYLD